MCRSVSGCLVVTTRPLLLVAFAAIVAITAVWALAAMPDRLAAFLTRNVPRKDESMSPLRDEISFINDYLSIEMTRFGDKLKFINETEPSTLDRLVPSMLLQPIIENSIKHGLSSKVEGGSITLRTRQSGDRIQDRKSTRLNSSHT